MDNRKVERAAPCRRQQKGSYLKYEDGEAINFISMWNNLKLHGIFFSKLTPIWETVVSVRKWFPHIFIWVISVTATSHISKRCFACGDMLHWSRSSKAQRLFRASFFFYEYIHLTLWSEQLSSFIEKNRGFISTEKQRPATTITLQPAGNSRELEKHGNLTSSKQINTMFAKLPVRHILEHLQKKRNPPAVCHSAKLCFNHRGVHVFGAMKPFLPPKQQKFLTL